MPETTEQLIARLRSERNALRARHAEADGILVRIYNLVSTKTQESIGQILTDIECYMQHRSTTS